MIQMAQEGYTTPGRDPIMISFFFFLCNCCRRCRSCCCRSFSWPTLWRDVEGERAAPKSAEEEEEEEAESKGPPLDAELGDV